MILPIRKGTEQPMAKLDDDKVREMRLRHEAGESYSDLGKAFGVDPRTASAAIKRRTWSHVK